jgi:hypothetical protein
MILDILLVSIDKVFSKYLAMVYVQGHYELYYDIVLFLLLFIII